MIDRVQDHIIVCGYGRVWRRAAEEFRAPSLAELFEPEGAVVHRG